MGTRKRFEKVRHKIEKIEKKETRAIENDNREALRSIQTLTPVIISVCRDFAQGMRCDLDYETSTAYVHCSISPFPNRPPEDKRCLVVKLCKPRFARSAQLEVYRGDVRLSPFTGGSYFWSDTMWSRRSFLSKLLAHSRIRWFLTRYTVKSRLEYALRCEAKWILEYQRE